MERPAWRDLEHTGPGTLAGTYLRMFWQPVYRSENLVPGRAVPGQIMSEAFTIYRGEGGEAHVVAFRCAHRGTQLSTGWVEDDALRCFYHGWKYNGAGQCVEQPGEDEAFKDKVRIKSYPVQEYLGLIFAYLGEGEAPSFPRYPDFEVPGVLEPCVPEYWPCNYFNRIDNACDLAHVTFAHREAIERANRSDRLALRNVSSEETDYGVRSCSTAEGRSSEYTHFHMPNVNQVRVAVRVEGSLEDAEKLWGDRISWRVPYDDTTTVSFSVDLLHLTGEAAEAYRERRRQTEQVSQSELQPPEMGDAILAGKLREKDIDRRVSAAALFSVEDYVAQVGQGEPDRSQDRLGRIDVGVILLRKVWERELRALDEGKPLKEWTRGARLATMTGAPAHKAVTARVG